MDAMIGSHPSRILETNGSRNCRGVQRLLDSYHPGSLLDVKLSERGRGLWARDGLSKGDTLLSVPFQDVLCVSKNQGPPNRYINTIQHEWQNANRIRFPWKLGAALRQNTPSSVALTLWLSWMMKSTDVAMKEYFEISLPSQKELNGMFLATRAELNELQFHTEIQEVVAMQEWVQKSYRWYVMGEFNDILGSLEDFTYAMALVTSRSFAVSTQKGELALTVPFCDLANHDFHPNCQFKIQEKAAVDGRLVDEFVFIANKGINMGSEIHISYGEGWNNWKLLKLYGFCMASNPNSDINWEGLQLLPSSLRIVVSHILDLEAEKSLSPTKLENKERIMDTLICKGMVSQVGWQKNAVAMIGHCYKVLENLPTSLEEDMVLLAGGQLSPLMESIVAYRAQKKEQLLTCSRLLERIVGGGYAIE